MSQSTPSNNLKKRNYISPQKNQTSIIAYTNQKSQKKINNNATPPRSALERSQAAILGINSPPTATKLAISNNPYQALSEDDEEEVEDQEDTRTAHPGQRNYTLSHQSTNAIRRRRNPGLQ
jgi:hypothetical protein